MDKTTKELRARLRDKLCDWLARDVPIYLRTLDEIDQRGQADGVRGIVMARLEALDEADGKARLILDCLANSDEIGLLVAQLGERRPLKYIAGAGWVVCRPGLDNPSLPHDIKDYRTLLELMAEAIIPEWIDRLADDAPDIDGLNDEARRFLKAMLSLGLDASKMATQDDIWQQVSRDGDEVAGNAKREAATRLLKDRKLIAAKSGAGTTLTPEGLKLARLLK